MQHHMYACLHTCTEMDIVLNRVTAAGEKAAQRAVVESAAQGGRAAGGNTARKVLTKFLK